MSPSVELLATYLHLARAAEMRRQPLVRDRVLLLAGAIALQIELGPIAELCRERILAHNPGHLLSRWATFQAAANEEEFQTLVTQLAARYGPEHAERLVEQLGIERGRERAAYASDGEFAASLLSADWEELQQRFGP